MPALSHLTFPPTRASSDALSALMQAVSAAPAAPESKPSTTVSKRGAPSLDHATRTWGWLVIAVVIVSNAALLIAQQVAFRLLAPHIGSSIETWSTIIGVFLLGIALGNRIAGKLADHFASPRLVVASLAFGSASLFAMPWIADWLAVSPWFSELSLTLQIVAASILVCLMPGVALSLATQPSLRSIVSRAEEAGAASGRIFAWATFGSLFGNYLAGFVLLALLGVRTIVWITGWSLLGLGAITILLGHRQLLRRFARPEADPKSAQAERAALDSTSAAEWLPDNWYLRALITVVACSFVSGAVESAAFRILAPLVGVSMFLSAGVVGVVLAGMSLGNAYGGRLATRYGTAQALRTSLAACAAATLLVAPLWKLAVNTGVFTNLGLIPQIILWSFTLFFLPSLALGTITPQVIRLSVRDVRRVGTISGQLYAWSTMGCIAGILASAWFLIEALGAVRTSIVCGLVPVVLIWLVAPPSRAAEKLGAVQPRKRWLSWSLLAFASVLFFVCESPYDRESKYFSLGVMDDVVEGRRVKKLILDRLVHSAIDLDDPGFLHYPHERVQGDFARVATLEARTRGRVPRVLVIGGGGYSFPRWLEAQSDLRDVRIDVVEIDPEVTEIAHDRLGLSRQTRINSYHLDGRQFVKAADAGTYDLVIQDAVNDYSVPYHLMTAEYNALIQRMLRPDGVYLLTVIDALESGRFLASAIRTMQAAFADTTLMAPPETATSRNRAVFVIAGHDSKPSGDSRDWWKSRTTAHIFPKSEVVRLLKKQGRRSPLLTDDFAPVDILMTSHFLNNVE